MYIRAWTIHDSKNTLFTWNPGNTFAHEWSSFEILGNAKSPVKADCFKDSLDCKNDLKMPDFPRFFPIF